MGQELKTDQYCCHAGASVSQAWPDDFGDWASSMNRHADRRLYWLILSLAQSLAWGCLTSELMPGNLRMNRGVGFVGQCRIARLSG